MKSWVPSSPAALALVIASAACAPAEEENECVEPELVDAHIESDTTWSAHGGDCPDYRVASRVDVNASLVIEPGVIALFEEDAGLRITTDGELVAEGSADEPILLTGTEQVRGHWSGVHIRNSESPDNALAHVTIEYAGRPNPVDQYNPGYALLLGDTTAGRDVRVRITDSTFRESEGYGLFASSGVDLDGFARNTMTANQRGAAAMALQTAGFLDEGSDYTGNDDDDIVLVFGNVLQDARLARLGDGARYRLGRHGEDASSAAVLVEAALSFAPGVVVEVTEASSLRVSSEGSLSAVGTEEAPITFTGVDATAGSWSGIQLYGTLSEENVFDYVVVEHGGRDLMVAAVYGNVVVGGGGPTRLTVTNSTIRNAGVPGSGQGYGLWAAADAIINGDACAANEFSDTEEEGCLLE